MQAIDFALNSFAAATGQYEQALALWPDDEQRPELLFRYARAAYSAYDDRREAALEAARDALLAIGDTDRASEAEAFLSQVSWDRGDGERTLLHLARAEELAGDSVSSAAARVLAVAARNRTIAADPKRA
jgi:hypothetical protein